jgi:precorrin-4 C11-methyltransferase
MIKFETINQAGERLAHRIQKDLRDDANLNAIVFIGALGICVRRYASLIQDKYTDPAIICVDSTGRFVIPVLSGHVGGANDLAREIAEIIGGEAVITTQSDNTGLWALDTLSRKNGWKVAPLSHQEMNSVIATFVNQKATALVLEVDDEGTQALEKTCPAHVEIFHRMEDYKQCADTFELLILVSPHIYPETTTKTIQYFPPCLHLGVGCQKEAPVEIAAQLLQEIKQLGYAPESIVSIDSIELKKDEPLLRELTALLPQATKKIFTAQELSSITVPNPSEKVFEVTGCYGVAESSALAASTRGKLVVEKQKGYITLGDKTSHYTFALAQDGKSGHIEIVGAGPGDPDLVSVRGRKFLERADLILYAGSLVPRELTFCAKPGATVRSSADLDLEEQFELMKQFYDQGKLIVRLHTGDPCIYGAIQEQMAFFDQYGMSYHITPGISSFLAAAAELRSQFTIPEKCQTIILTRGEGRTPMPKKEKLHLLAQHQSTMCIFLSASIVDQVQQELLDGGYSPDTPVAACYKLTWKDEKIYRGKLKDLAQIIKENHLTLTTMIVVGDAIDNRQGLSKLYDGHFTHLFRKGKDE